MLCILSCAPEGTRTAEVVVKLVEDPPESTVAPESTPFTKTRMPLTSAAAVFNVMVVEALSLAACELDLAGESIRKTELGLIVTLVSPTVLGVDERPGVYV